MATHTLGKLKFNLSKQGLAYRWGDGQVRRLFGRKKVKANSDNTDEYNDIDGAEAYDDPGFDDAQDYADDPGYDDGYADDDYADDGYADNGYDDGYADDGYADGYADDDYADDGYADDGYADDGYADDGYADDEYADDDGYYDENDEYDDRYSDTDAGEDYVDEYPESTSPLMQYVEENDWVTYLLLFLFPPLGIYLLWRRNKFEKPVRYAVSAASGVWFIVAMALIFSSIFGAPQDTTQDATITLAPSTTVSAQELDQADGTAGQDGEGLDVAVDSVPGDTSAGSTDAAATVQPSPTPLTGGGSGTGTGATQSESAYVYSPATGYYYHSTADCKNIEAGVSVSRVPKDVAENNRKQSACPVCIGTGTGDSTTYYATLTGEYYHSDKNCQGMADATPYTKEAAERVGKQPCPVCVTKIAKSTIPGKVKFISESTDDKSKISVYSTANGKYYHMTANCSGMTGAKRGSLKDALLAGKAACPTCCKAAGTSVYCTKGGSYYHTDKSCSGMKDAMEVTLAEALVLGKTRCHTCVKSGSLPTASQLQQASDSGDDGTYVYGTANGKYYHTDANCSGMKDAQRYTLKSMLLQNRKACPKCASAADTVVYATKSGKYYHSYANCSGMTTATEGTMAEATSQGYKRCPKCWTESTSMAKAKGQQDKSAAQTSASDKTAGSAASTASTKGSGSKNDSSSKKPAATSAPSASATANNTYVYATKSGSYYHVKSNCSGMRGASRITLKQALNAGKKACPSCAASSKRTVYATHGGKYYHAAETCKKSGMKNGKPKTLAKALMDGQTACKYCIGRTSTNTGAAAQTVAKAAASGASASETDKLQQAAAKLTNSHTYKSGKSGIKVYARADGKYYHSNSTCSGMTNASRITLETAMNYGKKACPKCCASSRRTVYATQGGKYYHNSKDHAGSGAKSYSLARALASGFKACPYCVTKTATLSDSGSGGSNTYKSGTSGIKVYATVKGKYYHSKSDCSDMKNASRITLETALNYGKKACPKCMASASKKVYVSSGDKYYHFYKAHAGSGAKSTTLAVAKASGKKQCPKCTDASPSSGDLPSSSGHATAIGGDDEGGTQAADYNSTPSSSNHYSAPADTIVYVDLGSSYYFVYHKSSSCSAYHMKHGDEVTLEYARNFGFKACPSCQPPTSVG